MFKSPEATTLRISPSAVFEKYFGIWGLNAMLLSCTKYCYIYYVKCASQKQRPKIVEIGAIEHRRD